jgi:hypothetical protein
MPSDAAYRRATVRLTRACNLNCPDCALKIAPGVQGTSRAQWHRIIMRWVQVQAKFQLVTFTGGEPTLCDYLARATEQAKSCGATKKVRVCTNGVKHGLALADFGVADIVQFSDYGALNGYNFYRLSREDRRRVKLAHVRHVPTDITPSGNPLPADCPCISMWFCGDKVYPCSCAALKEVNGCSIEEDFVAYLNGIDPRRQDICRTCFLNRKNRKTTELPLILEFNVWESRVGRLWVLPWRMNWLRRIYRFWLWGRR